MVPGWSASSSGDRDGHPGASPVAWARHNHVPAFLAATAAQRTMYVLVKPSPGRPAPRAVVVAVLASAAAMVWSRVEASKHESRACDYCFERWARDSGSAEERAAATRWAFWLLHAYADHAKPEAVVRITMDVAWTVVRTRLKRSPDSSALATAAAALEGWRWLVWASDIAKVLAFDWHERHVRFCPWCNRGDGDGDERLEPEPLPGRAIEVDSVTGALS